ncbi:MAG TPA: hypothetical protein VFS34_17550 [Thermoanaerobaculia bacterium]|nr:hypothetical protein [Thermoanaerobaculia bacterium]
MSSEADREIEAVWRIEAPRRIGGLVRMVRDAAGASPPAFARERRVFRGRAAACSGRARAGTDPRAYGESLP